MHYLIDAHDAGAVRGANFLETLGGTRHLANLDFGEDKSEMVALISGTSALLDKRYLRRLRKDNQEIVGVSIPCWAIGVKEVIVLNAKRVQDPRFFEALRQLHSKLSEIPLPKKKRRRRPRDKGGESPRGCYIL